MAHMVGAIPRRVPKTSIEGELALSDFPKAGLHIAGMKSVGFLRRLVRFFRSGSIQRVLVTEDIRFSRVSDQMSRVLSLPRLETILFWNMTSRFLFSLS